MGLSRIGFSLVLAGVSWTGCETSSPKNTDLLTPEERTYLEQRPQVRLAPDPHFPPVESFDENGVHMGLIADYFSIIEQRIEFEIDIVQLPDWDEVMRQAQNRLVDGITAAQITQERQAYLFFSQPIVDIPNVIIARRGMTDISMNDLHRSGAMVALTKGNAIHEYVQERFPGIRLELVRDDLSALESVAFGHADATVVNLAIASHLIRTQGLGGLSVVGDSGRSNPLAIATRNDDPMLARILAKGLAAVTPEEKAALYHKWIGLEPAPLGLSRKAWTVALVAAGVLVLCFVVGLAWVAMLRRRVAARTKELEHEFLERKRAEEERHAMERKLLEAQKLESLGVLAGGIAHDFNNLLMSIMGNADLALLDVHAGPLKERLEDIMEGTKRASDLARQMLAYSGRGKLVVEHVDLCSIVREMVRLLSASISKSAEIQLDLPPALPFIEADASQLRQVIMNLVTNAAEALPDGQGKILISVRLAPLSERELSGEENRARDESAPLEAGDYAVLTIRDQGIGMSEETLAKIFEPFFTTKFQGRGLGMSAVIGIVRGHRGALFIRSKLGEGTTFTVAFPVRPDPSLGDDVDTLMVR
jgi:signal transduction histidine kinase